jgi:hypothetical protein
MQKLLDFLGELERRRIWYRLYHARDDTIMVELYQPGWHWEVELFADGRVSARWSRAPDAETDTGEPGARRSGTHFGPRDRPLVRRLLRASLDPAI